MKYTSFSLALMVGFAAGACDPEEEEAFADDCRAVGDAFSFCRNFARDEGDTYFEDCIDRGKKVRKENELCGKLWVNTYDCVAALPCEDFEVWRTTVHDDTTNYPCHAEEQDFLAECPDLPLWVDK